MLKFQKMPAPYLDFCIISAAGEGLTDVVLDGLQTLSAQDLPSYAYATPSGWVAIVGPDVDRLHRSRNRVSGVSGIAKVGPELLIPHVPVSPEEMERIDPEVGIYTSFLIRGARADIKTDLFGYGQSYASQHENMAIVSNRLHLHKLVMDALGLPVEPDGAAVTATLFSLHGFFAQQNALTRTTIKGVRLVPVSDNVDLADGKYRTTPKTDFLAAHGLQARSYDELISAGTRKIVENTMAALSSNQFTDVIADVTGGKDSRLVLGALTQWPGWPARVKVNTTGAPDSPDVAISAGLANHYGASYFRGDDTRQHPISAEDNLTFWRSYYFGQYHRFAAGAWSNLGSNQHHLTLGGANGEIYRGFWTALVERYLTPEATTRSFASALVQGSATPGFYSDQQLDALSTALADELDTYPATTLRGKVEDHYLFHRNRTHCGLRGFTFYHDRLTWYPLMSADLLAASRMISYEDRVNNKVIHDVLSELDPDLTRFRFNEDDDPFAAVRNDAGDQAALDLDEDTSAWADATSAAASLTHQRRAGQEQVLVWNELKNTVTHQALAALDSLERMEKLRGLIPAGLRQQLTHCMETWTAAGYQVASRIFAVHDAFEEAPLSPRVPADEF